MKLKSKLAATTLALALAGSAAGCTQYTAIAQGPENKVFVTKTTSYIIWTVNKMMICDYSAGRATNCSEVTED